MEKMNINKSGKKRPISVKGRSKPKEKKGNNNMNNGNNNRKTPRKPKTVPKGPPKQKVRVYTITVPVGTAPPPVPEGEEAYPWVLIRAATRRGDLYSRTVPIIDGVEPEIQRLIDMFGGRVQIVDAEDAAAAVAQVDQEIEGLAGAFGGVGVGAPPAWQWQPGAAAAAPAPAAPIGFNAQGLNDRWRAALAARGPAEPLAPRGPVWAGPINMPRFGAAPPLPAPPPPQGPNQGWGGENANLGGGRRTRKKKSKKSKKSRKH